MGLDTCLAELRQVGANSLRVAVLGVAAPFALGFLLAWVLRPAAEHTEHMFLAAALGATSIGITARVLRDLRQARAPEARIILDAAVMDDVLGLIMLAIVSGIVVTGSVAITDVTRTIVLATLQADPRSGHGGGRSRSRSGAEQGLRVTPVREAL